MNVSVLGLDMSSTSTGICAGGDCHTITAKGTPIQRAQTMRTEIVPYLVASDLVVVEAIATRSTQTAIAISFVHALVLDQMTDRDAPVHMIAPAQLKKYATGKGNADKDVMLLAAVRNGSTCNNNDEADAYFLWAIGCHLIGEPVVDVTKYRSELIATLGVSA